MSLLMRSATDRLKSAIRDVPDFPKPGVVFKDITPIFSNAQLFRLMTSMFADRYHRKNLDMVVAVDARGFLLASSLAYVLGTGVAIARKKGKLPYDSYEASYDLEYGSAVLQMHTDALKPGQRVVIIDDVLATGGTMGATIDLVSKFKAEIVEVSFLIELKFLEGRKKLEPTPLFSLIQY
jgi:adenine phosphoribosyltransferase